MATLGPLDYGHGSTTRETSSRTAGYRYPTFMALCNVRIRSVADDHVAETFGDLMDSMEKIHGPDRTAEMLPEYAAALAAAGRDDEASDAVTRYLALHEQGNQLSKTDNVRLDYAIDRLMQWGSSHSDLMNPISGPFVVLIDGSQLFFSSGIGT